MPKNFKELRAKMPQERQQRAHERAVAMMKEMPLQELRQARKLSQEALAEALGTRQSGISRLEKRTDVYVSTLRKYIEAMGGSLEIVARFPDGLVQINQFHEIEEEVQVA